MHVRSKINRLLESTGYRIDRLRPRQRNRTPCYNHDGMTTTHNHDFMRDPRFRSAYQRGMKACDGDYDIPWRTHVALWVASQARHLDGDFVECGVNRGFNSSAIMHYLDWNSLDRHFYLFDTFCGFDERYLSSHEKQLPRAQNPDRYPECFELAKRNFAEYKNAHLIRGPVPDTLSSVPISKVAYLHIDMNCAQPEVAAARHFWDALSPGAIILLDDYGFPDFEEQKEAMDRFAAERGVDVLSSPTGQGLIKKP